MQVTNIGEMAKDVYNFIPPQNLQTICNGNNQIQMTQSYDKAASSGANTLTSGMTSAGISTHSSCKNCKKMEEQERIVTYTLNQLLNQISDVTDKERLWRQGNISFEIDNFGINKLFYELLNFFQAGALMMNLWWIQEYLRRQIVVVCYWKSR